MWANFGNLKLGEIQEDNVDKIIATAIEELKDTERRLNSIRDSKSAEQLESIIWANAHAVSLSVTHFVSLSIKPISWIRKKLEDWLNKYIPALRAAIKALAKVLNALSYSISVGFPFNVSVTISWSPSTP